MGVAKRKPPKQVVEAVRAGLKRIGENYVQEAEAKIEKVKVELEVCGASQPLWHFVGRLQRNKARDAAALFDLVETVDRESLGTALDRHAAAAGRQLEVLLQVNLSGEAQKGGADPDALAGLLAASGGWRQLRVVGLMTIPAAAADPEASRPVYARLRELAASLREAPGAKTIWTMYWRRWSKAPLPTSAVWCPPWPPGTERHWRWKPSTTTTNRWTYS